MSVSNRYSCLRLRLRAAEIYERPGGRAFQYVLMEEVLVGSGTGWRACLSPLTPLWAARSGPQEAWFSRTRKASADPGTSRAVACTSGNIP